MELKNTEWPEDAVSFAEDEIAVVKAALKTKLFVKDEPNEARSAKFQGLLTALSEKFKVPEVKFEYASGCGGSGSVYDPDSNTLRLYRFSLTSTLMGFWRAAIMQKIKSGEYTRETRGVPSPEAFGLSAFKAAAPKMFEEAKQKGRLYYTAVEYTDGGQLEHEEEPEGGDTGESHNPHETVI